MTDYDASARPAAPPPGIELRSPSPEFPPRPAFSLVVPASWTPDSTTDAALLAPFVPWPGLEGPIGAARAHKIINAYSLAFFDRELRGAHPRLLDGPSPRFPEVLFESRRR